MSFDDEQLASIGYPRAVEHAIHQQVCDCGPATGRIYVPGSDPEIEPVKFRRHARRWFQGASRSYSVASPNLHPWQRMNIPTEPNLHAERFISFRRLPFAWTKYLKLIRCYTRGHGISLALIAESRYMQMVTAWL